VLLLLPPSETKVPVVEGPPFDEQALAFPVITSTRRDVWDALKSVGRAPAKDAPSAPAARVYAGPLYIGLDWASLDPAARRRSRSSIVIISALWGAIRPGDRIPRYRLHICTRLPGLDDLSRVWQQPLGEVLPAQAGGSVIVDFRVADWAQAWKPVPAERTVVIRVVHERGGRGSASYNSKFTRGLVARSLITRGSDPGHPEDLAGALAGDFEIDLSGPDRPDRPWLLSVVEKSRGGGRNGKGAR
jgi:hypothetical protein